VSGLVCPKCGGTQIGRTHRNGLLERVVSLAYIYPFRCATCQRRFRRFRWGARYVRVPLDRRDMERIPARIPVTFHWKDGGQGAGTVRDISTAGCAVETDAAVPVGALVLVRMAPPDSPPIDVDVGEVRSRQARRIGVRFVRVAPEHAERLRQLIQHLIAARSG
jgi:hypothetical protein